MVLGTRPASRGKELTESVKLFPQSLINTVHSMGLDNYMVLNQEYLWKKNCGESKSEGGKTGRLFVILSGWDNLTETFSNPFSLMLFKT